ncbi:ribokinase [Aeromicrobium flavum]|uniref:Ribokinase n=1 Tax=Aeromicrobium flavum TaxID=416568 RepID=A0A512HRU9_9ACTN|nr:carbohydrate kinase [Aeromicrobium flavum]GEO88168.1 ribokinase [Aeromicrobium flavum]
MNVIPRALVVGEALVDVTRKPDGTVAEHPGGSPLNVAVTMARQGIDTTLATQVGDDRFGDLIRAHLDASGVTLVNVGPPAPTASATAALDARGAATYEFDLRWDPEQLPDPSGFDLVHVGSIGAWMAPGADTVAEFVRRAHAQGVPVGFDPNIRPALAPSADVLRRQVFDLASVSRFVKLSDEDAEVLADEDSDVFSVLRELAGSGPAITALTRGGESALLTSTDQHVEVRVPQVKVADTIGAGDTWMGTLLAELLRHDWVNRSSFSADDLRRLGQAAVSAAAITVSRPGADPPWHGEFLPH